MNAINATVGIYDTAYTAVFHRDGSITVRAPFISWSGNTGSLKFERSRFIGREAEIVREFFKEGELVLAANTGDGALMLTDVLAGQDMSGISITGRLQ